MLTVRNKIKALSIMIGVVCFRFVSQFLGKYSPQSGTRVKVWWQSCHIWHLVYPPHDISRRSTWPDFLVLVIWRYIVQYDVHPKFTSNLTAGGLTSQRCRISLPAICYTIFPWLHSLCLVAAFK